MNATTHRRLLDLLAGWSQFVADCAENATSPESKQALEEESEAIHDFYQEIGTVEEVSTIDVSAMMGRIEALLRIGPPPTGSGAT